ncbi:hypothetical protein HOLleu_04307 [Holothuria leucospilota]|uniref:Uncharacterized protein n=1 Tax=Holothuria leucospilota TaxID=206669 RepID=A0A9Q1HKR0_HOLLE|nr:hypothetical protein HOLleu_04307 [Holothuria leucospilota]
MSNTNGRKRICEAADIRKDTVTERLKLLGDHKKHLVYHMTNDCYKKYTLRKTLNKVIAKRKISDQLSSALSANEPELRRVQSQGISHPPPSPRCDIYSHKCVICTHVKHLSVYTKFRISETDRAKKFLEATVFLQDDVYSRTCDLQDEHSVFGADLFCHKLCIRNYLAKFDPAKAKPGESQPMKAKKRAWFTMMPEIEAGLRNGDGYEFSQVRDCMNSKLNSDIKSSDEVPFPSHFGSSQFTIAAFDNFDHDDPTLSGIGGSHDTVSVLFQGDDGSKVQKQRVSETRTEHGPKTFNCEHKCQELQPFYKPAKRADLSNATETHPVDQDLLQAVRTKDLAWSLARLDLSENQTSVNIKPSDQTMPAWRETNTVLSEKDIPKKRVGFLPVLPYPVTQYDTVYTALKNFSGIPQHLDQPKLPVSCDEGAYHIARETQLIRPEEFRDIVLCMGSFHMAKVALDCLGEYLKGSGAESATFGVNVVDSVLGSKNYSRSLKGFQLLKEALLRLQWEAFFKEGDNVQVHKEQLDMLVDLKGNFDQFIDDARSSNETFKYWDTFIYLIQKVENLVRADRDGDLALHLQAVKALLPIFAAFDSTNYLRWCSLYLKDMYKLPDTAPGVYQAFIADHQQVAKSASGIIGNTRKKKFVAMWELIYHEMLAISNLFRELSGVRSSLSEELVISKTEIATGEQKV